MAWAPVAGAQQSSAQPSAAQPSTMPIIGFLNPASPDTADADRLRAFRQGLRETGFVEGENAAIEYRWAENKVDRLSAQAAGFVRRGVSVIVAIGGSTPAFAAKAETSTIPIVFAVGQDPVGLGLVASLARPGGNLTGVSIAAEATARRLDLLRELLPAAKRIAVLVDPANAAGLATMLQELEAAARPKGLQTRVLNASSSREVDAAFASMAADRPDALFVGPFSIDRRVQMALLSVLHKIPAVYPWRDFIDAGGLMSYGPNLKEAYHQAGIQTGRILKGAKPGDVAVVQSSKFELVINASTARMLGITVPSTLRGLADEMVE